MSETKNAYQATVDIMSPGSAFVIVDGQCAHVWRSTRGTYVITIDGDDAHKDVKSYAAAVAILAREFGKFGTISVTSENEGSGKVTRYEIEVVAP